MATIVPEGVSLTQNDTDVPDLDKVRQFEQLGFRAWPAAQIINQGSWAIQHTPYYPSKRGNSVNPLDPFDDQDLMLRIDACESHFQAYGQKAVFRLTPLAPVHLASLLKQRGYQALGGSAVLACDLAKSAVLRDNQPRLSLQKVLFRDGQEIGYSRISAAFHQRPEPLIEGLAQILCSIKPEKFITAAFKGAEPAATMLCVSEDGFTGLLDLCIAQALRRRGYARALVINAMYEALERGNHTFWLQVERDNIAALALYHSLGFKPVYDYIYYCSESL